MTARPSVAPLVVLRTWLLPVALAAGAMGVHWALHVPPGPLPPPSAAKLEEEKKAAEKKKREEDKKKREEDRKAGKKQPKAERGPKELAYEPFTRPRKQFILDQLYGYYDPTEYKDEPTFEAWQSAHKPLISQIVHAVRQVGFNEPPGVSVLSSECKTIRCRFTLVGPDAQQVQQLVDMLRGLEVAGGPLWHAFDAAAPTPEKKGDKSGRMKAQITASFTRDLPALADMTLPGKGSLRDATPATPPGAAPATGTNPPQVAAPGKSTATPAGAPGKSTTPPGKTTTPVGAGASASTAKPSPTGATAPKPRPG